MLGKPATGCRGAQIPTRFRTGFLLPRRVLRQRPLETGLRRARVVAPSRVDFR